MSDVRLVSSYRGFNVGVLHAGDALVVADRELDRVGVYLINAVSSVSLDVIDYQGDVIRFVVTDFIGDWRKKPRYEMTRVNVGTD